MICFWGGVCYNEVIYLCAECSEAEFCGSCTDNFLERNNIMSKKQTVFNLLFLVIVFGLTMYLVFRGKDIGDIISTARDADGRYLLLSLVCVVFFISWRIGYHFMMKTLGASVKMTHCALYSFVGFFFSCITPSHQADSHADLLHEKDKLPIPVTTLVLMIVTITYKAVLVVIGVLICFLGGDFLRGYLGDYMWVFYLGVGSNVFCVTLYDDTGICSRSCEMDHGKRSEDH